MANEPFHSIVKSNRGVLYMLDFEKAFDPVG